MRRRQTSLSVRAVSYTHLDVYKRQAIYLLPAFSKLYGLPLDAIVQMGNAVNGNINSIVTLVVFAVAPMNPVSYTHLRKESVSWLYIKMRRI